MPDGMCLCVWKIVEVLSSNKNLTTFLLAKCSHCAGRRARARLARRKHAATGAERNSFRSVAAFANDDSLAGEASPKSQKNPNLFRRATAAREQQ